MVGMALVALLALVVLLNLGLWWYQRRQQLWRSRDDTETDVSLSNIAGGFGAQQHGGPDERKNREDTEPVKFQL
jgi:hypothetical protein